MSDLFPEEFGCYVLFVIGVWVVIVFGIGLFIGRLIWG